MGENIVLSSGQLFIDGTPFNIENGILEVNTLPEIDTEEVIKKFDNVSEAEITISNCYIDPIVFNDLFFGIKLRWYQKAWIKFCTKIKYCYRKLINK